MEKLACPECGSHLVTVTEETTWMANSGDHYCHSVKSQDSNAKADCLSCEWQGQRDQLVTDPTP